MEADYKRWGIVIDSASSNVASFRGYSYDPDAYFNHQAIIYKCTSGKERDTCRGSGRQATGSEGEKVEAVIRQIEACQIDITTSNKDWFAIGSTLADAFEESGRDYFHRVSQFHPEYNTNQTDRQYTYCLRRPGHTIATFYHHAGQYGLTWKEQIS